MNIPTVVDLGRSARIALFVDAENFPAAAFPDMIDTLARRGSIDVRRAFGDWSSEHLRPWRAHLQEHAVTPVQAFGLAKGKNAADIALVVDVMDLVHQRRFDTICIASSDSDFTPLALRLRAEGVTVIGCGEAKTPHPFVRACTTFHRIAPKAAPVVAAPAPAPPRPAAVAPPNPSIEPRLETALRQAFRAGVGPDGWASMMVVGNAARRAGGIEPAAHGARNFSQLFAESGLFEVEARANGHRWIAERARAPETTARG